MHGHTPIAFFGKKKWMNYDSTLCPNHSIDQIYSVQTTTYSKSLTRFCPKRKLKMDEELSQKLELEEIIR